MSHQLAFEPATRANDGCNWDTGGTLDWFRRPSAINTRVGQRQMREARDRQLTTSMIWVSAKPKVMSRGSEALRDGRTARS